MIKKLLLYGLLIFSCASTFAQIEPGLVAWYPLDGNTNDSSGNNNNGTIVGGITPTTGPFGNPNGAYHFDGSSGYINCPNDSQLLASTSFSYSAWFRVQNRPGGWQQNIILANIGSYEASGGFEAGVGNPPMATSFSMFRNATHLDQGLGGLIPLDSGVWYNLIVVSKYDSISDSTTVTNYIDSVVDVKNTFPGSVNYYNIDNFWIGANIDITCCQRYFLGDISDVKVYDIALPLCAATNTDSIVNLSCGDSITFGGTVYKYSTIQTDTFTSQQGCDSIVTLYLYVTDTILLNDTTCSNNYFLFYGNFLDTSGIYMAYRTGNNQCDSLIILTLTVNPSQQTAFTVNLACGDSFAFGDSVYKFSTIHDYTFTNMYGCDSLVTLYLHVTDTIPLSDSICAGDSLLFNGAWLDTTGVYEAFRGGVNQCDSLLVLSLNVKPAVVVSLSWDSMTETGEVNPYGLTDTLWCTFNWYAGTLPLYGAYPLGGSFNGFGVFENTIFADSFVAHNRYTYLDTITYSISENGCTVSAFDTLRIELCEGIAQINAPSVLQLYPDPANDYLSLSYAGTGNENKIELLDIIGRAVFTSKISAGTTKTEIDTRALSNGLYFIRIESGGVLKAEGKFTVAR